METQIKHRNITTSVLVALISLLAPGIGHVIGGKFARGAIIFCALVIVMIISDVTHLMYYSLGARIIYVSLCAILLIFALDSYAINRQPQGVNLQWYNKWYIYILMLMLLNILNGFVMASWGYRQYIIEKNDTNSPTIKNGDIVIAQMAYGQSAGFHLLKSAATLPQPVYIFHAPKYIAGDMVLYHLPSKENFGSAFATGYITLPAKFYDQIYQHEKNKIIIRRLIASAGDNVEIKHGQVFVNQKLLNEPYVLPLNNVKSSQQNFGPVRVPAATVFVLGDNRDNSLDSRHYGFIPIENIQGKVISTLLTMSG